MTIRQIIKQGQDTLYRLQLGRETQILVDALEKFYGGENWPQSLGELCLEIYQDKLLKARERPFWNDPKQRAFMDLIRELTPKAKFTFIAGADFTEPMSALRRAMYRKERP